MSCNLGDFSEYARIREDLSQAEKTAGRRAQMARKTNAENSLMALRPGDVIRIPRGKRAGPAVVLTSADRPADPRPQVLTAERQIRRISTVEVPGSLDVVGRVKIPPEKGTPFVERVEFPNEWRVGDEHGLIHDGLQGDGELEMRIEWRVEDPKKNDGSLILHSAILKVNAWLAYGCAEGARLMMRKAADTMGKCCTVQRVLRDDSVVVRVDGVMGESTVDPTPLTVVRTSSVRHEPGTRLLYLHDKVCVDAVVEPWPEKTIDVKEGSRHRLRVLSQTVSGWVTWKLKDGTEFLKQPKDAEPADFSVMTVHGRAL